MSWSRQRDRVPSAGSWRARTRRAAAHTRGHVLAPRVGAGYVRMRRHAGVRSPPHNGVFLQREVKGQRSPAANTRDVDVQLNCSHVSENSLPQIMLNCKKGARLFTQSSETSLAKLLAKS